MPRLLISIACMSALIVSMLAHAATAATAAIQRLDQDFVCPEAMASDDARMAALRQFGADYAAAEPRATPGEMIRFRRLLLEKHGCAKTLASVRSADKSVQNGDVERQAWLPIDGAGPVKLFVSADHLTPVLDPRFPTDHAVDTYARIVLLSDQTTNVTHTVYDEVVSHSIYYCASDRYALVQNDYFHHGAEVFKDPSPIATRDAYGQPLYATAPIPSGSINAVAARWACSAVRGSPA